MKERLNYDKIIIGQSFFMEVIMKKGIIIAIILCLLGMIFLSGSVGVFYKPVEVSNKVVILAILFVIFIERIRKEDSWESVKDILFYVIMNKVINMKHIFILKPDTSKSLINCIVTMMQGKRYELRYTKDLDDARKIALSYQDEKEVCRLYAIGGDGFVHKVVNVIQCRDDLYCINVFCCGLDADVGNLVNTNRKTTLFPRIMQYSLTILDKIFHLKFYPTDIYTYNKDIYQGNVLICTFCNGHYFGGGYQAGYYSSLEDGMIDMSVVPEISKKELLYYLKGLITNTLQKNFNILKKMMFGSKPINMLILMVKNMNQEHIT